MTWQQLFYTCFLGGFPRPLDDIDPHTLLKERQEAKNLTGMMPALIILQWFMGEVLNSLGPVLFNWVLLHVTFGFQWLPPALGNLSRSILPRSRSSTRLTGREAELALRLPDLQLSMEYTFLIVFPMASFVMLFLVNDEAETIFLYLLIFAVSFCLYHRFLSLWGLSQTFCSDAAFQAFSVGWGFVLSLVPSASICWLWRTGNLPFVGLTLTCGTYIASLAIYYAGLEKLGVFLEHEDELDASDPEEIRALPDYTKVVQQTMHSWWSMNPVYVLKQRHCPDLRGHECLSPEVGGGECWPRGFDRGFYEFGKEFRHLRSWAAQSGPQAWSAGSGR